MDRAQLIDMADGARRGNASALADFKKAMQRAGYEGRRGGWIYAPSGVTLWHGWQSTAARIVIGEAPEVIRRVLDAHAAPAPAEAPREAIVQSGPHAGAVVKSDPTAWPAGVTLADLTPAQRQRALTGAAAEMTAELNSPAVAAVLTEATAQPVKVRDIVTILPNDDRRFEVLEVAAADNLIRVMPMDSKLPVYDTPKWVSATYAEVVGEADKDASYAKGMLAEFNPSEFVTLGTSGLPGNHITVTMALGPSPRMFCGLLASGTPAPLDLTTVDCLGCLDAWTAATYHEHVTNGLAGTPAQSHL